MPFTLKHSNKAEMIEILSTWEQSFQQKPKDSSKKEMRKKALSIASQMQRTLAEQTHAHLWIAKESETNAPMAMMIVDDTAQREKTIRFLLSNQKVPESKGSGLFLVHQLTEMAARKRSKIKTTSENADKFWRKCPGFSPDPDNSGDYVCEPSSPVAGADRASMSIFSSTKSTKKNRQKIYKTCSLTVRS